eukprot:COSAG01_NODE_24889_length_762_cov_12.466063_1_plen_60_part_10
MLPFVSGPSPATIRRYSCAAPAFGSANGTLSEQGAQIHLPGDKKVLKKYKTGANSAFCRR